MSRFLLRTGPKQQQTTQHKVPKVPKREGEGKGRESFRLCNSKRKYVDNIRQTTRCGPSLSHRIRQQAGIRNSRSKAATHTDTHTHIRVRTLIFCCWQLENSFLPALPAGLANLNQILAYRIKQKCRKLHKLAISTLPNCLPITSVCAATPTTAHRRPHTLLAGSKDLREN